MNKYFTSCMTGATMALTLAATDAFAETEVLLETVEGWDIYQSTDELGCVMERVMDDGYLVRMGKTKAGDAFGYVAIYTKKPVEGIYGNVTKEVEVDIDGQRFTGTAVGDLDFRKGYRGGTLKANNPAFGQALAKKYVLTLNPDKKPVVISLDGTLKAMAATQECDAHGVAVGGLQNTAEMSALDEASLASWNSLISNNKRASKFADDAIASLVFPKITKAGLVVGGESGNGSLFKDGKVLGHYRTSSLSVGAQAGAQSYGYTVMFLSQDAYDRFFANQRLELGVDASVAVFRAGVTAEVDTTNVKTDTVAFIYDEEGLMANWTFEGTRIRAITP